MTPWVSEKAENGMKKEEIKAQLKIVLEKSTVKDFLRKKHSRTLSLCKKSTLEPFVGKFLNFD